MAFKATSKTNTRRNTNDDKEPSNIWINVGVMLADDEGNQTMARLPRGIAVDDLVDHRIYANTAENNPEWFEQAKTANSVMAAIRAEAENLAEGEAKEINLSVQLYRSQESAQPVDTDTDSVEDLRGQLFG